MDWFGFACESSTRAMRSAVVTASKLILTIRAHSSIGIGPSHPEMESMTSYSTAEQCSHWLPTNHNTPAHYSVAWHFLATKQQEVYVAVRTFTSDDTRTQSHNPIRHPHWAQHYPMSPGLCMLVEPGLSCVVPAEIILTAISMPDSQNAVLQVRFHLSDHCYQPSAYVAITQEAVMRIYLSAFADMYEILAFFSWYCAKTLTPDIHVPHETLWYLFDMEKWHHNTIHDGILP